MRNGLRDLYLRIDARSLGLFRLLFGVVLIGDLLRRWSWLRAFYSNEGVLPNHNHLFNLRDSVRVWSFLHAFSTPGENHFAFALILFVYVAFLLGWHTRVFHLLALVALVSLTSRNILLENAGNYSAISLLAFTAFLPLGSRFSIDALRASLRARDEKTAEDLDDRGAIPGSGFALQRGPGWSPVSLAALAVLLQIVSIYACSALRHGGSWRQGSALYYALHVERYVSGLGVLVRNGPLGVLKGWSYLLYAAEWAIPALLLVPALRRTVRGIAAVLMVLYALTLGLLLSFGLYAWTLLAATALVLPTELWDSAVQRGARRGGALRIVYDADCGVCLWIARVLRRVDAYGRLSFIGNDELGDPEPQDEGEPGAEYCRGARSAKRALANELPPEVTPELADTSVLVVDSDRRMVSRGAAVAAIVGALPLGRPLAWVLRLPGISHALDAFYDVVATRRQRISVLLGMDACGVPAAGDSEAALPRESTPNVSPSVRTARILTGGMREIFAAVVLVAMLAQTGQANPLPRALTLPQGKLLVAVAGWPRMIARWDILAPEPPQTDGWMVVDAQTKAGESVDPLTGVEPNFDIASWRGTRMGQLWSDYITRIHDKEWEPFQKAFKDYLAKGGPRWADKPPEALITGLDAYWVKVATAPPGDGAPAAVLEKEKLFTHSRGGRMNVDRLPMLNPSLRRQ